MMDVDAFTDDAILSWASYLQPRDLVNLALTCKRFGATPEVARTNEGCPGSSRNHDHDAPFMLERCWSLMDEVSRQRVVTASKESTEWQDSDLLSRHEHESWIEVDNRLQLMRTSLVFHRIVGNGVTYIDRNNPTSVHIHEWAIPSSEYPLGSSCAICQEIMTSGRHYAEFTVKGEGYIEVGIMRPIQGWDTREIKTMHPKASKDYKAFCNLKQQNADQEGYNKYEGNHNCYLHETPPDSFGRSNFLRNDCVVGMSLDLDKGTLTVYKNGRCLGVEKDGLTGHYCWVASLTNAIYRGAVKIERGLRAHLPKPGIEPIIVD